MTTNLSGSLSEFSLAEVLSLLGMGGRTARMQVTSPDSVGTVHLVDGRISSATADSARAGLLRAVVAALSVPADDLAHALQSEDPVRALVESGVVDREAAQEVASEHCTESVGEMLEWTSGEFAVWVGTQDPADIGVRLGVDELVAAARERAREWHDLRAALPDSDSVLTLVPDVAQAPVVDVDDWAVLARVDGRRTLTEVLAAMGASPLAAGNRLVQLMGRGLVAVRVGGGDAEREHMSQMLDALDAGSPIGAVVELVAQPEPPFAPDVHDLFVTEPEAVAEWQVAAVDSWAAPGLEAVMGSGAESATDPEQPRAEEIGLSSEWAALVAPEFPAGPEPVLTQSFPAAVEPTPSGGEPVAFAAEPVTFQAESRGYEAVEADFGFETVAHEVDAQGFILEPVVDVAPVAFESESAFFEAEPVSYESQATTYGVDDEAQEGEPVTFDLEPVAVPVGESFAWSPWAQEMGLGEAPVVADAQTESFTGSGFADMVEDAAGHGHTDAFPVPQAPVDEVHVAVPGAPVDEVAQFMPQPRDPGDGVVDPSTYAQAVGAHAAHPEDPAPQETSVVPVQTPGGSAADPPAGGLLAHLMSSVRGL
jgi:Domain of unknown function (DUF4388)